MRGLTPRQTAAAAVFRGRRRLREAVETLGGLRRLQKQALAWGRDLEAEWARAGVAAWLRRPGAGRLWIDVDEAREWCRETCTPLDLELADAATAGRFDLIGSGQVSLGDPPTWRTDLYSGMEWPLDRSSRYRIVRGDGSDIRTVWELSRFYHLLPLARAAWSTGSAIYARTLDRHIRSWLDQNPIGYGPNWASPMDVALRCCNWAVAVVLFAGHEHVPSALWAVLLGNLHSAGRWLEHHLEWHPVYRGNHFVATRSGSHTWGRSSAASRTAIAGSGSEPASWKRKFDARCEKTAVLRRLDRLSPAGDGALRVRRRGPASNSPGALGAEYLSRLVACCASWPPTCPIRGRRR